ncbi:MAG: hydrogenase maturation nickel metallochaperone HypA [Elusimicrobiota bacterium]
MHELGLAQDLLQIILEKAEKNLLKKITKIVISVGKASGIDIEYLHHSIVEHVLPGTIAKNAEIEFIVEQLKLKCSSCNGEISSEEAKNILLNCPRCGSIKLTVLSGADVYVKNIEGI